MCMQEAPASTLSTVLAGGDHGSQLSKLEASLDYMSFLENHPWFLGSMGLLEALSPRPQRLTHYPAALTVAVAQKFFVSLGLFFRAMFSSPLTWQPPPLRTLVHSSMHGPDSLIHLQDLSLPVTVGVLTKSLSVLQKAQLPLLPATGKSRMAVGKKSLGLDLFCR